MTQQRQALQDIAARYLGRGFSGNRERDIELLQTLLDKKLVRPNQTAQLQGMGIILGDLLAAELGVRWVVYEDRAGRSRALQLGQSGEYLFPVTMISRRREVGNTTSVSAIYEKAKTIGQRYSTPLPFQ